MEVKHTNKIDLVMIVLLISVGLLVAANVVLGIAARNTSSEVLVIEAPEQTESFVHEAFVVEEYESIIPDGENVARLGKAAANGQTDVYGANKAIDGKTGGASYWEGATDDYPNIITVTLPETHSVHAIRLCLCPLTVWGPRTQTFSVLVSRDGENFEELIASAEYNFTPKKNNEVVIEFDRTDILAARIEFTGNTGAGGAQLAEFELYE